MGSLSWSSIIKDTRYLRLPKRFFRFLWIFVEEPYCVHQHALPAGTHGARTREHDESPGSTTRRRARTRNPGAGSAPKHRVGDSTSDPRRPPLFTSFFFFTRGETCVVGTAVAAHRVSLASVLARAIESPGLNVKATESGLSGSTLRRRF